MHKILKIVAAVLSLIGIVSLVRIIAAGDEAIKTGGEDGLFEPMAWIGYITLGITVLFVLFFVFKNLFTNTSNLKNTLIGVGAFLAVLLISYLVSGGDAMKYKLQDGIATDGQSTLVGAGLVAFYILLAVAAITMIFAGVKKVISK
jgi:protein-S-isoprenylcysteine O-methyltransferase Ste14